MPIRFACVDCGARIKVPDGSEGRKVRCPSCDASQRVPQATDSLDPEPAAAEDPAASALEELGASGIAAQADQARDEAARRDAKETARREAQQAAERESDEREASESVAREAEPQPATTVVEPAPSPASVADESEPDQPAAEAPADIPLHTTPESTDDKIDDAGDEVDHPAGVGETTDTPAPEAHTPASPSSDVDDAEPVAPATPAQAITAAPADKPQRGTQPHPMLKPGPEGGPRPRPDAGARYLPLLIATWVGRILSVLAVIGTLQVLVFTDADEPLGAVARETVAIFGFTIAAIVWIASELAAGLRRLLLRPTA